MLVRLAPLFLLSLALCRYWSPSLSISVRFSGLISGIVDWVDGAVVIGGNFSSEILVFP